MLQILFVNYSGAPIAIFSPALTQWSSDLEGQVLGQRCDPHAPDAGGGGRVGGWMGGRAHHLGDRCA